jgi:HK97 family phage major capsid protein
MTELSEIKGLVEQINPTLVELRKEVDAVKSRDVVDEAKFTKMADDVTAKLASLQEKQAKLEAMAKRPNLGGKDADPEFLAEHKAKFNGFIRNIAQDAKQSIEVRAMSTNVQADGGYLVRPDLSSFVVSRVFETSPMRLVANVESGSAKSREYLIDDDEADSAWTAEGGTQAESNTPEVGEKEITAHTQRAMHSATWEMLQDAYLDVEAWLAAKVSDKFARTENTAFIAGNGVGKPRGVLTYADRAAAETYQRDRIRQLITGAAGNVTADGFITQQNALKEAYQPRAVWMMKRTTFGTALKQKGADNYFFSPVLLRDGQASMQLLGKPVIFADDVPPEGAGNLSVLYGDFSVGYTIYDRIGLQIIRDPFVLAGQGRVRFVIYKRVGGDVTNFESFNIGRCAAS